MIERLELPKNLGPRFAYARTIPFLAHRKALVFRPGLNVLFGPNASGKSTVLQMLATHLAAAQGGISTVTEAWVREVVDFGLGRRGCGTPSLRLGFRVVHDGQPVLFADPRQAVGLAAGGCAFDNDFFDQGVQNTLTRGKVATGEQTLRRLDAVLAVLQGKAAMPTAIQATISKNAVNSIWEEAISLAETLLVPGLPAVGGAAPLPTILLDEPESGLGIPLQARLWNVLAETAQARTYQVIVASHSVFALGLGGAHYLDTAQGYRGACEEALARRAGHGRIEST